MAADFTCRLTSRQNDFTDSNTIASSFAATISHAMTVAKEKCHGNAQTLPRSSTRFHAHAGDQPAGGCYVPSSDCFSRPSAWVWCSAPPRQPSHGTMMVGGAVGWHGPLGLGPTPAGGGGAAMAMGLGLTGTGLGPYYAPPPVYYAPPAYYAPPGLLPWGQPEFRHSLTAASPRGAETAVR